MSYPLKFEDPEKVFFITSRTISSKLWFVNNLRLEDRILALLARYQERYGVILYGFILMGNHYHLIAQFPNRNKCDFMKAFNAMIAKLAATYIPTFTDGKLWARRYSDQVLPRSEDIEHWWYYCALNPVSSGLTSNIRKYVSYNSFDDAVRARARTFKIFHRSEYREARRNGRKVTPQDFIRSYTLKFSRLPGYQTVSGKEYREQMEAKLVARQSELVVTRERNGLGFATPEILRSIPTGSSPRTSKISHRYSLRPLVLTLCAETKKAFLETYFTLRARFAEAVQAMLAGNKSVNFPLGTYQPVHLTS